MQKIRSAHCQPDVPPLLRWIFCCILGLLTCSRLIAAEGMLRLTSIHALLQARQSIVPVLLRGTVTYKGRELIVQDGTGALAVAPLLATSLSIGDEIEVEGHLEMRTGVPVVKDAIVRDLWSGSTPLPLAITPDEAAEGAYNGMLVTSEGRLIKAVSGPSGAVRLTIDGGNQIFTCVLEQQSPVEIVLHEIGSTVRCTGALSVDQAQGVLDTGSFLILLRTVADVRQLSGAPWWTPRHLQLLFVATLALAWLGYRIHLRNNRVRLTLVLEERLRIAREIHDTLAQGFAGIALQLQSVSRTMGTQSEDANAHLEMALQMVRRSRAEAHRSIATLRTLHTYEDLADVCERLLRQLTEPAQIQLSVTTQGASRTLPDEVTSQILRIAQEAVANTIEHASARAVTVTIDHAPAALTVEIKDDGHGFDLKNARSLETGHFGIAGMQERAAGIRARLILQSGSEGTKLRLHLPLMPETKRRLSGLLHRRSISPFRPETVRGEAQ